MISSFLLILAFIVSISLSSFCIYKTRECKSNKIHWILSAIIIFIYILLFLFYIKTVNIEFWPTPEKWGAFGDFFGGVLNPIVGFFTIILLLFTLSQNQKALSQNQEALLQGQEALKNNAEELQLTREELAASKEALEEQAKTLKQQTFDSVFFSMLSFLNDAASNFEHKKILLL